MTASVSFGADLAQHSAVNTQNKIETLVITAPAEVETRWGQTYNTHQQLPDTGSDIGEKLQGIAGLQVDSRSNYAQDTRLSLRGFGARSAFGVRGVQLQLDGVPLTMPDGQGQTSGLLLDGIGQVQVISGPVANLYGNAAGGVVQFYSATPNQNRATLNSAVDEIGLARQQAQVDLHNNQWALRAAASHLDSDGLRPHSQAEKNQQALQAFYETDNALQIKIRLDHENSPQLQDPLGLTLAQWNANPWQTQTAADIFNTQKSLSHQQQSLTLSQQYSNQAWQLAGWTGQRNIRQWLALKGDAAANSGGIVDLARDFSGINGNYNWYGSQWQLSIGGNLASMRDARLGYINNLGQQGELRRDEMDRAKNRDNYAIAQYHLTPQWHWLIGARHSQVKFSVDDHYITPGNVNDSGATDFSKTNFALATTYKLREHLNLRIATGKGFETPTLAEMAYSASDTGFNLHLNAATQQQTEMGLDYEKDFIKINTSLYRIGSENELSVLASTGGRTTYYNAQQTRRQGLEFRWQLQQTFWGFAANLNAIDANFEHAADAGKQLPGIAKYQANTQIYWLPLGNAHLNLQLQALYRSTIASNDSNSEFAPAFSRWDLALETEWQLPVQLVFTGWAKWMNILDKPYVGAVIVNQSNGRSFEPGPGSTLALGIEMQYGF